MIPGTRMIWAISLGLSLFAPLLPAQDQADADRAARQRALKRELDAGPQRSGCPVVLSGTPSAPIRNTDFVQLQRIAGGWGTGGTYTVRISGDGSVVWDGLNAANLRGSPHRRIDPARARMLIGRFQREGFFGLCAAYSQMISDAKTSVTSVGIGMKLRQVYDYADAAPAWLRDLDEQVDILAGIQFR